MFCSVLLFFFPFPFLVKKCDVFFSVCSIQFNVLCIFCVSCVFFLKVFLVLSFSLSVIGSFFSFALCCSQAFNVSVSTDFPVSTVELFMRFIAVVGLQGQTLCCENCCVLVRKQRLIGETGVLCVRVGRLVTDWCLSKKCERTPLHNLWSRGWRHQGFGHN